MSNAESPAGDALALDDLDLALGTALGFADVAPLAPTPWIGPRQALTELVVQALRRPPCLVAFSGGRDSSVVLALAAQRARHEGLPLPVPVSHRFPGVADSAEDEWQELVVRHLSLPDWTRLTWTDELDVLGPYARRARAEVGPYAPANQHFFLPFLDLGQGGSLLSGSGGDELFGLATRPVAARVLYRPHTARPRDLRGLLGGLRPRPWRARRVARNSTPTYAWLNGAGQERFTAVFADMVARSPIRYDDAVSRWLWRGRGVQHGIAVQQALGRRADVVVLNPFEHQHFLAAFAGFTGPVSPGGRGRVFRHLFGDLLPTESLGRAAKASFLDAFVAAPTRRWIEEWDGTGVDNPYVDLDGLRQTWEAEVVTPQSLALLTAAADRGSSTAAR